jgi:hypothetical protein
LKTGTGHGSVQSFLSSFLPLHLSQISLFFPMRQLWQVVGVVPSISLYFLHIMKETEEAVLLVLVASLFIYSEQKGFPLREEVKEKDK